MSASCSRVAALVSKLLPPSKVRVRSLRSKVLESMASEKVILTLVTGILRGLTRGVKLVSIGAVLSSSHSRILVPIPSILLVPVTPTALTVS